MTEPDHKFMRLALAQAHAAKAAAEVPVGAVVVHDGQVIATGRNAPIEGNDPTAHAEIVALRNAAAVLGNYRLDDCDLYVTLEPCPMCSGALLHARVRRVIFGASDPKTGAAGSVVDLFANRQLNHQTEVTAGVLAYECGALLSEFFRHRRHQQRRQSWPLRDDALRTQDTRFEALPGYPWHARYVNDLPALTGLRMHYLDEGDVLAPRTWLFIHGACTWSYVFRDMLPVMLQAGDRVVAPDLVGFGRSDKPKRESAHSVAWQVLVLQQLVERLDLRDVILVVQESSIPLVESLVQAFPQRTVGVLVVRSLHDMGGRDPLQQEQAAYDAPFPDKGHRAALRAYGSQLQALRTSCRNDRTDGCEWLELPPPGESQVLQAPEWAQRALAYFSRLSNNRVSKDRQP